MSNKHNHSSDQKDELARGLKSRHVTMIALGGAIGAGIFQGSSSSIELAGPGVIISYLLAGIILYFVMQAMAEMAVQQPKAKTLRDLIETILGPFAGFFSGWIYFISWMLVMAAEMAAAAGFLKYWFPDMPMWLLSLGVSILITVINLFAVGIFGETEYWLAALKITVLTLFIILGGVLIFTGIGGGSAAGFSNLTEHGGFMPYGISGIAASMLVVMFSFGGTEMIGMTLGETENPEKVIPRAARSVIVRILVFYVLPILIIVSLMPWNMVGAESPFVSVFDRIGIPYVGGFMNFVLLTAVISAANTGMYAASRLLYTQALSGNAPAFFSKLSAKKVPVRALLASTSFLYIGVIIAVFAEEKTFGYLMVVPGYAILSIWILLTVAHLKSRKKGGELRGFYVKSYPYSSWFSLIALLAILAGILMTSPPAGTIIAFGVAVLLVILYAGGAKK
ncbi:amino acid permease [Metabacillus indicus]|uniref:Amino acid permease n=1 Tax=Metabacillus indicus TaxID=246786 RepID=A0A084GJS3_METID|nr:amino acid permease [Metabacillus indicus]KEZ47585.1 amino acid permease [Metabacillus indicus]